MLISQGRRLKYPHTAVTSGNLLQHWVLCEIILDACCNQVEHVAFIDAYSMAPIAGERPKIDPNTAYLFDYVRKRLPGKETPYEKVWYKLVPHPGTGYPNSGNLLTTLWPRRYSLLLCETDPLTLQKLEAWVEEVRRSPKCVDARVFKGDWRVRFAQNLRMSGDLVLLSFDPYVIKRETVKDRKPGNMYQSDLKCLAKAVERMPQGTIVQLSTYSAKGNSQGKVVEMVSSCLKNSRFEIVATVRPLQKNGRDANGQMMSLVLARSLVWTHSLESLESRFQSWQRRACAGAR